ncbi:MAG: hypothetical protein U0359_03200 [Byssovorax sp.]
MTTSLRRPLHRINGLALALVSLAALSTGCGPVDPIAPEPPAPYKPSGTLAFEIGTGEGGFQALTPTTEVPLNYGPQGGEHIWFAARCKGAGSPARVHYSIVDVAGDFVSTEKLLVLPAEGDAEGWRVEAGTTAFIDGNAPLMNGMKLFFKGHLDDDYGTSLDATAEAVLTGAGDSF